MNSLTTEAMGIASALPLDDDLAGVAVEDGGRDVGAGLGGVGGGLLGPGVQPVEGGGGLVGRGFRQRGHGAHAGRRRSAAGLRAPAELP